MQRLGNRIESLELKLELEREKTRRAELALKRTEMNFKLANSQARVANARARTLKSKVKLLEAERDREADKEFNKIANGMIATAAGVAGAKEGSGRRKKVRAAPAAPPEPEAPPEPAAADEGGAESDVGEAELDEMLDREFGRTAE